MLNFSIQVSLIPMPLQQYKTVCKQIISVVVFPDYISKTGQISFAGLTWGKYSEAEEM